MVSKKELLNRIEKLEQTIQQITETTIESRYNNYGFFTPIFEQYESLMRGNSKEVTLLGKVECIMEHLDIKAKYVKGNISPEKIVAVSTKPVLKEQAKKTKIKKGKK